MTDLEIAKTLKDAAQYIRDHGWIQGTYEWGGGVCALGAIDRVTADRYGAADPLYVALIPTGGGVAAFNDAPGRTAAEVLELFESVALQHELRALAVTTLSQEAATAVCDNTVPEAVNV